MPTRADVDRVIGEIKTMTEDFAFARIDENRVAITSHGRGTDDGNFYWSELTDVHRRDALASGIDWRGFTESEQRDVTGRVVLGEDAGSWMIDVRHEANATDRDGERFKAILNATGIEPPTVEQEKGHER